MLGFPFSQDFSNFQVPGLLDLLSPGTLGSWTSWDLFGRLFEKKIVKNLQKKIDFFFFFCKVFLETLFILIVNKIGEPYL